MGKHKDKDNNNVRSSIAVTRDRRDWLKGLGRKGDDYNVIVDAIQTIFEKYKITAPITPV